ncbi:hypothetical protein AB1Y20_018584 [Prymnesium parvum]|uniref:Transmembrane protein n=1 Tax=Prymnesium parvum TaxID=97485 RepID=A0AB34JNM1_PRYPA
MIISQAPPRTAVSCLGRCTSAVPDVWHFVTGPTFPAKGVAFFVDVQLGYAILLVVPTAFFRHAATMSHLPGIDTVPSMMGMLAGWAFGNAFSQLFAEARASHADSLCWAVHDSDDVSCTALDVGLACALTAAAVLLVTCVRPLTEVVELGEGEIIDYVENWIKSMWQLISKAAATSVMVVWNATLRTVVLTGTQPEDRVVRSHLFWLWATSATFVGSLLAVHFEKWEQRLRARLAEWQRKDCAAGLIQIAERKRRLMNPPKAAGRTAAAASHACGLPKAQADGSGAQGGDGRGGARLPLMSAANLQAKLWEEEFVLTERGADEADHHRPALGLGRGELASTVPSKAELKSETTRLTSQVEFSNIVQATLGWVAGCAWTEVAVDVFPTLSSEPSIATLTANTGVFALLTLLSCGFVMRTGARSDISEENLVQREEVEKYFLIGAMSFIVGWTGVLVLRAAFLLFGYLLSGMVQRVLPIEGSGPRYFALLVSFAMFTPLMTISFFRVKHYLRQKYRYAVALRAKHNWIDAAAVKGKGIGPMKSHLLTAKLQMIVREAAIQARAECRS